MGTTVDTKIVELKFNNDNFADKIDSTLTKLENLNDRIKEVGTKEALKELSQGFKEVDTTSVTKGVDEATKGFSKLEVAGMTALVNISNAAVNLGKKLVSNLISPLTKGVMQGGLARARNIEQANFQFEGQKISKSAGNEAKSYYEEVMNAVLGTSYSYDVAAKAAAQLAASNVGVTKSMKTLADGSKTEGLVINKDMTKALLGIAGVAAMTGRNFDDVAHIFTRVAGQSKVTANDLNSIAAYGLNAAAVLASSMGKTEEEIRKMVSKGDVSFEEFSNAMSEAFGAHAKDSTLMFQGALDDVNAALARIGADFYGPALNAGRDILNSITPLVDAIHTKLNPALEKTNNLMTSSSKKLSQYFDMLSYMIERVGEDGKDVGKGGMGDWIAEHMNAWTNLADLYKRGDVSKAISELGRVSKNWKGMGGEGINGYEMIRDYYELNNNVDLLAEHLHIAKDEAQKLVDSGKIGAKEVNTAIDDMVSNGVVGFNEFYKAFHKLWSESTKLTGITGIQKLFDDYVRACIKAQDPTERFNHHIETFFAILNGGKSLLNSFSIILGGLIDIFLSIAKHLTPLGQLFLDLTERTAQFVVKVADVLATSESFNRIIDGITSLITKLFSFINVGKICAAILGGITKAFEFMGLAVEKVYSGVSHVIGAISNVLKAIADKVHSIITNTEELAELLKALKGAGIIVMVTRIALALTRPAEILETIRNVTKSVSISIETTLTTFKGFLFNIKKIGANINAFLFELTNTLKRMQTMIVATAILEIALAVGALAIALYMLSKVNAENASASLTALLEIFSIMFMLVAAMWTLKKNVVSKVKIWEKTSEGVKDIAKAFVIMAAAVLIIAVAMKLLSTIDTDKMMAAFAVVEIIMLSMTLMVKALTTTYNFSINKSGLNRTATGLTKGLWQLIAMALAIKIICKAIVSIAKEADTESILQATAIVELIMWSLAAIVKWLSSDVTNRMAKGALSLLALAIAVRLLTKPITELSQIASMDNNALWSAVAAVGGLMTAMILLMKLMSGSKGLVRAGASLVLMAYAIKVLSDVVLAFSALNPEAMFNAISGIGMALFSMVIALALINPKGIIVKAAAIYVIVKALQLLSAVIMEFGTNNEAAWAGIGAVTIALLGLAGACYVFKKVPIGGILKLFLTLSLGALVMVEFGAALFVFGIGLTSFSMGLGVLADSAKKVQEVAGTIIGIFAGFAIAIGILTSVGLPAIAVILALGGAFILFGIAMQKVGSGMEQLATAVKILAEMKGELGTTAKNITDFVNNLKQLKKEASEIGESFETIAKPLRSIRKSAEVLQGDIDKIVQSYTELVDKSAGCITQLSDSLASISKINQDSFTGATEAIKTFVSDLKGISGDSEAVATISGDISSNLDVMKTAFDEIVGAIGQFKSLSYETFKTLAERLNGIVKPIQTLKTLSSSFDTLSNDLHEFVVSLGTMKENAGPVEEGATAISDALKDVGDAAVVANNSFEGLTKKMANILTDMGKGLEAMGKGVAQIVKEKDNLDSAAAAISDFYNRLSTLNTVASDVANGTKAVASAVKTLGTAASQTAKASKSNMQDSGGQLVDGLTSGMTNKSKDLQSKVTTMVVTVGNQVKKKRDEWYKIGSYLIGGMISGISSQQRALELQVQSLEAKAERAVKAKADIKSPSRVWMRIGAYMGEGLAIGIAKSSDQVKQASIGLASSSEDAIESAIMSISNAVNEDFDLNPRITPVVDLTNVRNGAAFANSALGSAIFGGTGGGLTASISHTIQNGGKSGVEKSIDDLADQIGTMTDTMNSRSLNNYINVDGATDPEAFADGLIRSFRLNARTV